MYLLEFSSKTSLLPKTSNISKIILKLEIHILDKFIFIKQEFLSLNKIISKLQSYSKVTVFFRQIQKNYLKIKNNKPLSKIHFFNKKIKLKVF